MISERPVEVEDRAVPGYWEGDLLMGKRQTAIGTLVERWSRYVMLFPLPDGNTAEAVRVALAETVQSILPQGHRHVSTHPRRPRRRCLLTEQQASTNPRLDDTLRETRRSVAMTP